MVAANSVPAVDAVFTAEVAGGIVVGAVDASTSDCWRARDPLVDSVCEQAPTNTTAMSNADRRLTTVKFTTTCRPLPARTIGQALQAPTHLANLVLIRLLARCGRALVVEKHAHRAVPTVLLGYRSFFAKLAIPPSSTTSSILNQTPYIARQIWGAVRFESPR